MSDQHNHHHHHHHRPHRLSVPPRFPNTSLTTPTTTTTLRSYPLYPKISTPTPTPSKHRLSSIPSLKSKKPTNSLSSLFLILFSLRSLYSLLPFLRSSPSFSLFPFSFLVSLLSFLLTLSFFLYSQQKQSIAAITNTITKSQFHLISAKSVLLAVVFLLRFQALRYCGTAATILAELSGNVAARFVTSSENQGYGSNSKYSKIRGFVALGFGLFLLSISWDRMECFPLSLSNMRKHEGGGFVLFPGGQCYRILPMLLPFLCGFLGCYERVSGNWGSIRGLGRKRVQLITLLFTTILLFFPALVSFFMFEEVGVVVSIGNLSWPLANTVVFGVILTENYTDDKFITSKDFQKEFVAIFVCTLVLELFYFPELSLCGLLFCGLLLWISIRELDPVSLKYPDLGFGSPDSFSSMVMKPIRHILSERKSRKIALFLFINTAYMVVEFVAGFMSNSLGLISDACHMLFDCAALAIGLYASYISRLPANSQYNYGRGRFEVLSGYVNAVLLVLVGALIVLESFERILDPQEISTSSLLTVSIGGLVVNMVGLIFFHEEHHHAHGGAGSCSHSHPHPHAHSHSHSHDHQHSHNHDAHDHTQHSHNHDAHDHTQHSHNHDAHDHTSHNDHHECSISHGKSCDGHDHQSHSHTHHDHHDHNNEKKDAAREQQTTPSHNHQHHEHEHECHSHDHHHNHPDHHEHHHPAGKHAHQNSIGTSTSPQNDSHESHSHDEFHAHNKSCNHKDHSNSSHIHSHQSDFSNHSPFESSDPQLKVPLLESVAPKETGKKHQHVDHNMEGIFLHVLADTLGSVGVVISTLLIKYKGWLIADPVCSIFISVMIISSVISLLRNSAEILLQRIPRVHEQELKQAVKEITSLPGVHDIGNLHVWSFTNTDVIGTLHLQLSPSGDTNSTKAQVSHILLDAGINDLTLQTESVKDK